MKPFLSTTFCDDIRQEVGGKQSFIGVYNTVMYVPTFPVTLPKLCVVAIYTTPSSDPPRSLKFRVLKGTEPMVDMDATPDYLKQLAEARDPVVLIPHGIQRVISPQSQVCFSPLQLDGPCILRVVAMTEKGEVPGPGLQIQQQERPGASVSGAGA